MFVRNVIWGLVVLMCSGNVKESDSLIYSLLPLSGVIVGPIIMDQVAHRVEHYLHKKNIASSFNFMTAVGTIAMVNLAHLPWRRMAALLIEK